MSRYPGEPEYSCPHFDEAIKAIEKAREINAIMRDDNRAFSNELGIAKDRIIELEGERDLLLAQLKANYGVLSLVKTG